MSTRAKVALAVVVAAVALGLLIWAKGLLGHHAALVAMAIGALAYSALRAWERLRSQVRRGERRWPPE